MFIGRQLQEKYIRKKKQKLYHVFADLEKAFDKVPRDAIFLALRRQLVIECLVIALIGCYEISTL